MCEDCEQDVAGFLWDELQVYFRPNLTPHPDDDFLKDLPIDRDEPNDWLSGFAKRHGLRARDWDEWPKDQSSTIRNFARWLSTNRSRLKGAYLPPRPS